MSTPIGERQAGPRQGKEKLLGTERMGPLLAPWLGLKGLWIAFPIADTLAAANYYGMTCTVPAPETGRERPPAGHR